MIACSLTWGPAAVQASVHYVLQAPALADLVCTVQRQSHILLTVSPAATAACLACAVLQAGLTALHYAAWQGSVDAVELLLEKGCNVNAADPVSVLTHSYTLSIQLLP
jgi:UDP-N-acetylglucosamine enolpyruvyl transferase